jgi:hypothetical protein
MTNHPNRGTANKIIGQLVALEMNTDKTKGERAMFRSERMKLQSALNASPYAYGDTDNPGVAMEAKRDAIAEQMAECRRIISMYAL